MMTEQNPIHQALRENEAHILSSRRAWSPPVARTFVCPRCTKHGTEKTCFLCHGRELVSEAQHEAYTNPLEGPSYYERPSIRSSEPVAAACFAVLALVIVLCLLGVRW